MSTPPMSRPARRNLDAAVAFFTELGMELEGRMEIEGRWAERTVGLDGLRSEIAMMRIPGGPGRLELATYHSPAAISPSPRVPPPNTLGLLGRAARLTDRPSCPAFT